MSWRDVLPIHPAAELFPLMTPAELRELGEDIKANGLKLPIAITGDGKLLDGRSRLDALAVAGVKFKFERSSHDGLIMLKVGADGLYWPEIVTSDPYAYVISVNIRRRHLHLTAEQRRNLIAELLKATPGKSDRQIAETVKASPTTVGTVRAGIASTVQSGQLPGKRVGKDGKSRRPPARKPRKAKPAKVTEPPPQVSDEVLQQRAAAAERICGLMGIAKPAIPDRNDIGPDSASEAGRLRARNEELERENRRLMGENIALRSEIKELKATGGDMSIGEFQTAIKKWEDTVETQRGIIARLENENATLRAGVGPPPADDGIPEFLRRAP